MTSLKKAHKLNSVNFGLISDFFAPVNVNILTTLSMYLHNMVQPCLISQVLLSHWFLEAAPVDFALDQHSSSAVPPPKAFMWQFWTLVGHSHSESEYLWPRPLMMICIDAREGLLPSKKPGMVGTLPVN